MPYKCITGTFHMQVNDKNWCKQMDYVYQQWLLKWLHFVFIPTASQYVCISNRKVANGNIPPTHPPGN